MEYEDAAPKNLQTKIFSETVCQNCSEKESTNMPNTDNMGRNKSMYYQG